MAKRQRYGDAILHLFSCLIYQNQNEILDRFCSYCCCKLCCFTTRTNFRTTTNRWMAKRKRYGFNGKIFHSTHQTNRRMAKRMFFLSNQENRWMAKQMLRSTTTNRMFPSTKKLLCPTFRWIPRMCCPTFIPLLNKNNIERQNHQSSKSGILIFWINLYRL